jgi:hypothetical protein
VSILVIASCLGSCLGLSLAPQAAPKPGNGGTTTAAKPGSGKSGGAPDLGDVLTLLRSQSGGSAGGGGPPPSPPGGTNVQVSSPSTESQFVPQIAVDPSDSLHLIAAASDDRNSKHQSAFYASFDGGASWSETFDADSFEPSVGFGRGGEVYVADCHLAFFYPHWHSAVFVGRSYDGGLSTSDWVQVTPFGDSQAESIAVDTSGGARSGTIYVAYTGGTTEGLGYALVAASSDGGKNWTFSTVSDTSSPIVYAAAAVDSQGVLGVAFYDYARKGIFFDSSSDGGVTFGTDVKIAAADTYAIPGLSNYASPAPRIAIDTSGGPFNDAIYVTWVRTGSDGPDVVFSKSTDHGATWSTPALVSDVSTRSQYAPAVAVDPNGTVNFGFCDCRDDPNNRRVRYYVSRSSDGGATIQSNVKVSDTDFDPSSYADGSYVASGSAIAASDRMVHPIWTDGRNGDNDIYTSAVDLDFHTDVDVLSAATGGTVTFTVNPGPLFQTTAYQIVGSTSGTTPGTDLFFVHLPLNYDGFMLWTIVLANSSSLPGFTGNLDATGAATASMVSGSLPPSLVGFKMDFAAVVEVGSAFRWASDATHLEIGN